MLLLKAVLLSSLWAFGLGQLEQPKIVISRATDKSASIPCKATTNNFKSVDIHWYRQKPKKEFEHLMYVRTAYNQRPLGGTNKKLEASKNFDTFASTLKINVLKKEDEATYYCTYWDSNYAKKLFGGGTKLVVIDRSSDGDISPKPTIFLPSNAEINLHKAGTYLCVLEKFFPDVIKIYWKEKDGNMILQSQQGDTMKTKDTYIKFSWLTVTGDSMDKEHRCILKHENNKGSVDQEIFFPPVNEVTIVTRREPDLKGKNVISTTEPEACLKDENGLLHLQLTSTSAYYTYFLLLLKSTLHGGLVIYCLCKRSPVCCDGKST